MCPCSIHILNRKPRPSVTLNLYGSSLSVCSQGPSCSKYVIYVTQKADAAKYCYHVSERIGQYAGATDGLLRVDVVSAERSTEDIERIIQDFSRVDSVIRVLFASNIIGTGSDLKGLYNVWRIGQPLTLLQWIQEYGRVGRDGGASAAHLFFCNRYKMESCMRQFCQRTTACKQLQVAYHFDVDVLESEVRQLQLDSGHTSCCSACLQHGQLSFES